MVKKEIEEWISKADKDLEEAIFLLQNNRPFEVEFEKDELEKSIKIVTEFCAFVKNILWKN